MRLLPILSSSRDTLLLPHRELRKVLPRRTPFLVFVNPCYCSMAPVPYVCLLYGLWMHWLCRPASLGERPMVSRRHGRTLKELQPCINSDGIPARRGLRHSNDGGACHRANTASSH